MVFPSTIPLDNRCLSFKVLFYQDPDESNGIFELYDLIVDIKKRPELLHKAACIPPNH